MGLFLNAETRKPAPTVEQHYTVIRTRNHYIVYGRGGRRETGEGPDRVRDWESRIFRLHTLHNTLDW